MAIIDRKEVEHVARLARLALGEDEITAIQEQIGAMLENAKILSEVNTDGVEPMPYAVRPPMSSGPMKTDRRCPGSRLWPTLPKRGTATSTSRASWTSEAHSSMEAE